MSQKSLEESFFADHRTVLDDRFWNSFVAALGVRLRVIDILQRNVDDFTGQALDVLLARINDALLPAAERIRLISQLGFLVCASSHRTSIQAGKTLYLVIDEGIQRELFTPSPFIAITRRDDINAMAVGNLVYLNNKSGVLEVAIDYSNIDGEHDDWIISGIGANLLAESSMLKASMSAKAVAESARDSAQSSKTAAQGSASAAALSAQNAHSDASSASGIYADFSKKYIGSFAVGPVVDITGKPLVVGALYFNTVQSVLMAWDGTHWTNVTSVIPGIVRGQKWVSENLQTTFAVTDGYDPDMVMVWVNGIKFRNGEEVDVSSGTDIVMSTPMPAGALVELMAFGSFQLSSIGAFVRADSAQAFTEPQKAQARANIGAGGGSGRNFLINSAMYVSQENGTAELTATGQYPADQWCALHSLTGGAVKYSRVISPTPRGSMCRLRLTVTTAQASIGAANMVSLLQPLELARIMPLVSSGGLKETVLSFGVNAPAGTYGISITDSNGDNSIASTFTISPSEAGKDVYRQVVFGASASWSLLAHNEKAAHFRVSMVAGANLQTASGSKAGIAGNFLGTTDMTNSFMGTVGNKFELFDCALYSAADVGVLAPPFQPPDIAATEIECQRYFQSLSAIHVLLNQSRDGFAWGAWPWPTLKRAAPTLSFNDGVGNAGRIMAGGTANQGFSSGGFLSYPSNFALAAQVPGTLTYWYINFNMVGNARL
jgi:hypothetical protein